MSACYKHDSFAWLLASCNFVGVPSLVNPREHDSLAGSLLHAAHATCEVMSQVASFAWEL